MGQGFLDMRYGHFYIINMAPYSEYKNIYNNTKRPDLKLFGSNFKLTIDKL